MQQAFHHVATGLPRGAAALWRRITTRSSSNFRFAFLFLSPRQRDGLRYVYEFCRCVDDVVDERAPGPEGVATARRELEIWKEEISRIYQDPEADNAEPQTELGRSLARTRTWFDCPREGFDGIIEGVAMDLDDQTYETQDELRDYCYRVASCVGFLCIAIFGDQSPAANLYAEHLGLALQYTNILRDVAEDAGRDRVYLPAALLHAHGLTREDVLAQRYDARFVAAASEFADRAEREYQQAWEAVRHTNVRAMLPAEVMGHTYHRILREIRDREYNVFTRRAVLRRRDKLKIAAYAIARSSLTRF